MAKFQSKPIIVEAEQFQGLYHTPWPPGVMLEDNSNDLSKERFRFYIITTYGQRIYLVTGDWVIKELDGNGYYSCKPEFFEKRFEPITKSGFRW